MLLSKIFINPDSGAYLRRKFFGVLFLFFISPSIYGQVTLPYEQSFEEVADATYSANQSAIPEMEEWSYEQTTENGILSIGKYIGNTTQALALGRSSSTTTSNYATLTLDMSGYDESTDAVLLDFNFSYLYSVDYAHDRVYVRGSDTDDWIEVYNWVENKGENNEWIHVNTLALSSALVANSQSFSSTFQVRFGERETYNSRFFYLDDVSVYMAPEHDIKVSGLIVPEASATLGTEESLTVQFENIGSSTETSIPFTVWVDGPNGRQEFSETATTSLVSGDNSTYSFATGLDLSAVGNYEVTVFSTLTGDERQSNDTLRANTAKQSVYSAGLPYFEDFEATTDTVYVGSQGGLVGLAGWSFLPDTENGNLSMGTYSGNETRAMKLAREESIYKLNTNNAILTLDLSDKAVATDDLILDFDFSQYSAYFFYEENKVYVRGSESDDWIVLYDWYANAGNNYEWIVVNSLAISDTLAVNEQDFSSTFQLRFGEKEDYASDAFLLDNVHVYERPAHELAAVALEVPASSVLLGGAGQTTVQYLNLGSSIETSVPLTVWIDGPSGRQEVSETATTSLATGDTLTYTFTAEMDFSEVGNYDLTVFSELSGDLVESNDTLRARTTKQSVYSAGLPYFEDFESITDTVYVGSQGELEGLSGWSFVPDTDNGNLSIGTYSGNETRAMKLAREESIYEFTVNLAVLTLDLSDKSVASDDLLLDFDFSHNSAYSYAENKVYVRGSESDDWIILYDWYANVGNSYEWIVVNSLAVSDTLAANDQDFSATFQLRFGEKEDYVSDAFLLDNVHVYERPAHDLAAVDLEIPASSPLLGATEQITVQYVNQGVSTETSVPLTVWIDGPSGRQEVSETATASLATGDTLTYTFVSGLDFSAVGNYELTGFSTLDTDLNYVNDTLRSTTRKVSSYTDGLPYLVDFNNVSDTVYTGEQAALVDLEGWSYSSNADNGRLTLGASTNSSGVAMALGRSSSYGNATNHAILTIDMNEYSAVD
ncbi:hypothetical protein, partial [Reichenbachiella sp. MSK19-1]|uniref:hypothetical protein n=1 Tax=Reichenbachiella sp. MSK19-1 TaxID=1897631 RepID=UPI0011C41C52